MRGPSFYSDTQSLEQRILLCEKLTSKRFSLAVKLLQQELFESNLKKLTEPSDIYYDPDSDVIMFFVFNQFGSDFFTKRFYFKWNQDSWFKISEHPSIEQYKYSIY